MKPNNDTMAPVIAACVRLIDALESLARIAAAGVDPVEQAPSVACSEFNLVSLRGAAGHPPNSIARRGGSNLPAEIVDATRLIEVLNYFRDQGYEGQDALVGVVSKHREDIALVGRIPEDLLAERVERALATFGL